MKKGRCESCDGVDYINVHHLTPKSEGGSDKPYNLATVCLSCHAWMHEQIDNGVYHRWAMTMEGRKLVPMAIPVDAMLV
jgi:predicted HNH restriction endonuclease